jgi:hypothetical protein
MRLNLIILRILILLIFDSESRPADFDLEKDFDFGPILETDFFFDLDFDFWSVKESDLENFLLFDFKSLVKELDYDFLDFEDLEWVTILV